ncbi:DMT family transporter [Cystobacter fuscus]|uniref:DMT family transporter n=1 Tax=Cystobacter fuscus TaxID=43 RepID=UPI002B2F8524|nr:DMT family transporter [Cystobacter fuscus]
MTNALLYTVTVLIWGSTWLAIKMQLGGVHPAASIIYRFSLAAVLMFAWVLSRGLPLRFKPKDHFFMALVGALMFSTNFLCFYMASAYLTSGLVAVIFSMSLLLNIVNGMLFFRRKVASSVLVGAACGLAGILLVFWPELARFNLDSNSGRGIALSLMGTLLFSLGNMASARNSAAGLPTQSSTAYGMAYGALLLTLFALVQGVELRFDFSPRYMGSLLYLALFGSVVAFGSYLTLLGRIGAERAAYATVLFPMIALGLSTVFEGFVWTPRALLGVLLALVGNAIVLTKPEKLGKLLRPRGAPQA